MNLLKITYKSPVPKLSKYNLFHEALYEEMQKFDLTLEAAIPITYKFFSNKNRHCYLLEEDDKCLGIIQFFYHEAYFKTNTLEIEALYIDPAYRQHGYATTAIHLGIITLSKSFSDIEQISLDVYESNGVADKLYTKLGFKTKTKTLVKVI
jgi:GNAT superfamily N-acetyltransferase